MSAERFAAWIITYERAWRTPGTEPLRDLFSGDATYLPAPFEEPPHGLPEIATFWEAEREGPDEAFTLHAEIVAADGATGVARLDVRYGEPAIRTHRVAGLLLVVEVEGASSRYTDQPHDPRGGLHGVTGRRGLGGQPPAGRPPRRWAAGNSDWLNIAGQPAATQISALQNSGWASSGHRTARALPAGCQLTHLGPPISHRPSRLSEIRSSNVASAADLSEPRRE